MENASIQSEALMRVTLIMPKYVGDYQLPGVLRHINDTTTTIDGLYTQLALIIIGDIQEAQQYEESGRAYLKEYYFTAIRAVSHKQIGHDLPMHTFDHYPFASLANPLLEFNRRTLGKYPVSVKPLNLSAITTGSINIDFLGVGKILDFIEHTVKQIRWEAQHEKEMATGSKRMALLEEQLMGEKIIEAHLTNEEKRRLLAL